MIESLRDDLVAHRGAPDKDPARRLATLEAAGELGIPFTTGILVGIGENESDRVEALRAIADSHRRHGHVQEVIVQNFVPKPGTGMRDAPPCPPQDHVRAIALARLILDPAVHVQAPPNLTDADGLGALHRRRSRRLGWGLTGDDRPREPRTSVAVTGPTPCGHRVRWLRPGAEADHLPRVRAGTRALAGRRNPVPGARPQRRSGSGARRPGRDLAGAARGGGQRRNRGGGRAGRPTLDGLVLRCRLSARPCSSPVPSTARGAVREVLDGAAAGQELGEPELVTLFGARGTEVGAVAELADELRRRAVGDDGHLRGQPEHQLHQRVHVQVHVLRVLQGAAVAEPAGQAVPAVTGRRRRAREPGVAVRRHRGVPAGRDPSQLRRGLLRGRRPRRPRRRTGHPHPRLHGAGGQRRCAHGWPSRWSSTCCGSRTPDSGRCPVRRRRSWTTRSAASCARTRSTRRSGWTSTGPPTPSVCAAT